MVELLHSEAIVSNGGTVIPSDQRLGIAMTPPPPKIHPRSAKTRGGKRLEFPARIQFGALTDRRLRFKKPLSVILSKDKDAYVVYCESLEQFGYGSNMAEALEDFSKTISEMYFYLSDAAKQGSLGAALEKTYTVLREALDERESPRQAA